MKNPFIRDVDEYKRDFDIIGNYEKTAAKHISLIKNIPVHEAESILKRLMETRFKAVSPKMKVLEREVRGDRRKGKKDLLSYLAWVEENNHVLAPNLVCYANKDVEESYVSGFIRSNMAMRSQIKKEGQTAGMSGDKVFATFCNILQANYKIRNNSISGATSSPYNPLYYCSAHTGLTSTTRTITTTANYINEKMLASNRHYYTPDVALANISYLATNIDLAAIAWAQQKYGIATPSVEFVQDQILTSCHEYWNSKRHDQRIKDVISNLTSLELCAVSLAGDLNALTKTNDRVMRVMYSEFMHLPTRPVEDKAAVLATLDDDMLCLVNMLSDEFMRGKKPSDVEKEDPELYERYVARIEHVGKTLEKWTDFIKAFITTDARPQNLHQLPTMIRKAAAASDTDSSISTTQNQVRWYTGTDRPSAKSVPVAGITAFFSSQCMAHNLAMLFTQMGVAKDDVFMCKLKYEVAISAIAVAQVTKHYMALESMCEGNMYGESKLSVKGVNLKNSNLPTVVKSYLEKYQHDLMYMAEKGEELTPQMVMAVPAYIEHCIYESLDKGEATYFRACQVKTAETYAKPMSSVYRYIPFWEECFANKYGHVEVLPMPCIKVQLNLDKPEKIIAWGDSLIANGESDIGHRIKNYCNDKKLKNLNNMVVPMELINNGILPKEVVTVVDRRKIIASMMNPFYLTASLFALHCSNKRNTKFFSDSFTKEEAKKHLIFDIDL